MNQNMILGLTISSGFPKRVQHVMKEQQRGGGDYLNGLVSS